MPEASCVVPLLVEPISELRCKSTLFISKKQTIYSVFSHIVKFYPFDKPNRLFFVKEVICFNNNKFY